jgi:hypothetical protein
MADIRELVLLAVGAALVSPIFVTWGRLAWDWLADWCLTGPDGHSALTGMVLTRPAPIEIVVTLTASTAALERAMRRASRAARALAEQDPPTNALGIPTTPEDR